MIAHVDPMAITWGKGSVLASLAGIAISGVTPTSGVGLQMINISVRMRLKESQDQALCYLHPSRMAGLDALTSHGAP